MFESFPILQGRLLFYREWFSALGCTGAFIIGSILLAVSAVLKIIIANQLTLNAPKDYILTESTENGVSHRQIRPSEETVLLLDSRYKKQNSLNAIANHIWHLGWVFYAVCPCILYAFHVCLNAIFAYALVYLLLWIGARLDFQRTARTLQDETKHQEIEIQQKEFTKLRKSYHSSLKKRALFALFLIIMFSDVCLSFFNTYGFGHFLGGLSINTWVSRLFMFGEACPRGAPCHIYATLPEDASTGVFINVHTHPDYETLTVYYDTQDYYVQNHALRYSANPYSFFPIGMELKAQRYVHQTLIQGLTPDTDYVIQIYYDGKVQATEFYTSLPGSDNPRDIVFATGGDAGVNTVSTQLTTGTGDYNPDVVIIGGDLAYDDNTCACYWLWDLYIDSFTKLNQKVGRLVPVIYAIGNHDVGLNSLAGRVIPVDLYGPHSMMFYPQYTDFTGQVPAVENRRSYHYHTFGNILFFAMDSGYLADYYGAQIDFVKNVSQTFPNTLKFASYHNPTFYTCIGLSSEQVTQGLLIWNPVFDKYQFAAAFENHEHTFKKSFPLRGNAPNPTGTYFLGNGNWGAEFNPTCVLHNSTGVMANYQQIHHFWLVNVSVDAGLVSYTAYDNNGNMAIPMFEQEISDYVM